ncbi:HAD hydrolase-like protein [Streptomyces sp. UG1]|uniref:HAD hydrolase-like protein n=1 Tax=Streptomyces sp. UG1 TaxID=3417652 RepID=UPI003CE95898
MAPLLGGEDRLPRAGDGLAVRTFHQVFAGKPNPLMMRTGLNAIGTHSETSALIGDRMDTDALACMEAGMETFLVLTGLTRPEQVENFPYRPSKVVDSIADLVDRMSTTHR